MDTGLRSPAAAEPPSRNPNLTFRSLRGTPDGSVWFAVLPSTPGRIRHGFKKSHSCRCPSAPGPQEASWGAFWSLSGPHSVWGPSAPFPVSAGARTEAGQLQLRAARAPAPSLPRRCLYFHVDVRSDGAHCKPSLITWLESPPGALRTFQQDF